MSRCRRCSGRIGERLFDGCDEWFFFGIVVDGGNIRHVAVMSEWVGVFDVGDGFFVSQGTFAALFFGGEEEAGFDGGAGEARGGIKGGVLEVGGVGGRKGFFGEFAVDSFATAGSGMLADVEVDLRGRG